MSAAFQTELDALADGGHGEPRRVLGPHPAADGDGYRIRALHPKAESMEVRTAPDGSWQPMRQVHPGGIFEFAASGPDQQVPDAYVLRARGSDGHTWEYEDPYRFPLQITEFDLYLHGEGTHFRTYLRMGAHPMTLEGVDGVHFAVWAPNAVRVSVVGDFNQWDGRVHPMQRRADSGLWEIFLPGMRPGTVYKYELKGPGEFLGLKADPYAFAAEMRPQTASVVWDHSRYDWNDRDWMKERRTRKWHLEPVSVYEVHLSSWRRLAKEGDRWLSYRELADTLVPHVKELGFSHIELLPITEHPFDGSWGYQTIGYYAATSRFGTPDDLKFFIDVCHREGIGVILDWVPAHFPKDGHGLAYFDGTHLYEHSDPRQGEHRDWGTLIFNYGRNEVRTFLLSSAMYWADVFHIDGLRVDAVASMLYLDYSRNDGQWIPNRFGGRENLEAVEFLKTFNQVVHADYPGFLTFAEESTAWPQVSGPVHAGGLGFDLKWNMGWMNDTLEYFQRDPIHRRYHHNEITFSLVYAFSENFILPFSHDEVVHGKKAILAKMPGDAWQQFANARLLYAYMYAHPGKKLLFMGNELGVWDEWDSEEGLPWHLLDHEPHAKLRELLLRLNRLHASLGCLHLKDFSWEGFEWIDLYDADQSVLSFVRKGTDPDDCLVCIFNMTPAVRDDFRVGVPRSGAYREILNTDDVDLGGSGIVNPGVLESEPVRWNERKDSLGLRLPPLAAIYLRPKSAST